MCFVCVVFFFPLFALSRAGALLQACLGGFLSQIWAGIKQKGVFFNHPYLPPSTQQNCMWSHLEDEVFPEAEVAVLSCSHEILFMCGSLVGVTEDGFSTERWGKKIRWEQFTLTVGVPVSAVR